MRTKILLSAILMVTIFGVAAQNSQPKEPKTLKSVSVSFGWNKTDLTKSATEVLNNLAEELKSYPDAAVSIVGWADKTGSDKANASMSFRRAESVKAYLIQNGVDAAHITAHGAGVDVKAVDNAQARRADITATIFVTVEPPKVVEQPTQAEPANDEPKVATQPEPEQKVVAEQPVAKPMMKGWSVGVNAGIPFFWGDMLSMAYDKTYIGFSAGVQGGYRFSQLFAMSISADYAQGKTGARDYSKDYAILSNGMTIYDPATGSQPYSNLYSKISVVNVGLAFDFDMNRLFYRDITRHKFNVWVSPTVYGQFFSSDLYAKSGDTKFSDGTTKPSSISLGLGGSLSLRYKVSPSVELQLKNSLIWITDNKFDGITMQFDKSKQDIMWTPQIGVVWSINNK